MELLADIPESFVSGLGPGVWDIHSRVFLRRMRLESLLKAAIGYGTIADLWVNPDCGLKTRDYEETKQSLRHLVDATKAIRASPLGRRLLVPLCLPWVNRMMVCSR